MLPKSFKRTYGGCKSMKIGIYTHYLDLFPQSAPSLYQIKLIENLSKLKNIEIVLVHHIKNNLYIYKNFDEAIISKLPYFGERDMNKLKLDVIHFNAIPCSWRIMVNKIKCRKVVTVHGDIWWVEPHLGYNKIPEFFKRLIEPRVVKYFDLVIAVSRSIENTLIKYLKYPEERIKIIYEGIDHYLFYPRTEEEIEIVKKKYKISNPYILHVSMFSKIKNPHALFRTFKLVKEKLKNLALRNIKLIVVGSGWSEKYKNKLYTFGLDEIDVMFLGFVNQVDLPPLYSGAELYFHPSYHESFGFPNLEAMACGCPVVTSNKYAIPEIVGDAGILHDPNDYTSFAESIVEILTNESLRKKLIRKGLKRAKIFSWEKTAEETYKVYKEVLDE